MTNHHDRHVAIVLYGFAKDPQAIADDVGYGDVEILRIGDIVGRRPSAKNRITWRFPIFNDDPWDYGIDALIAALGGAAKLKAVMTDVTPDAAWLRICVPSVGSPWQESGGIHRRTLGQMVDVGLDFDVAVFAHDPGNPTHGPRQRPPT
jgi:hypothetical protein